MKPNHREKFATLILIKLSISDGFQSCHPMLLYDPSIGLHVTYKYIFGMTFPI